MHDLQRVETLFQSAADLPAAERRGFLDRHCPDDEALREHVESLLARLDAGDSLAAPDLTRGVGPGAGGPEGPGAIIGRYKLLQVIGEGGFGVVYMAEQQRPVVRKVALKIIKLGMDTREVVARFEAERQALALMDHPSIAKVLDGGATESGRPYFVMELVRGVAITDYCDRNELTTRQRLELFVPVCHAVQHAHQKGVIHRDLKPTNVLVTLHDGHPVPKVIDFGVAKAMHTRLTEKTLFTRYEQFIGTPAYMSPEQAEMSALDVDTRTDIYSLGVLLYELLTGSMPFDTDSLLKAGVGEIQRIIREEQPPRPSLRISSTGDVAGARHRRLDVPGLSRLLRGDLDWIVMKSLEKERSRRYDTASALAEDIRRHLAREPVLAGPPGAAYRLGKVLSRNRAAVLSVTFVALALVGGIIGTTLGMMQAERNAREADRQARLAREKADHALVALDFLVSTLSLANPEIALDPDLTVQSLLDDTAARAATAFGDQPWAEARIRATIGRAYAALGEDAGAEPHLRRAVELVDTLTAGAGPGPGASDATGYDAGDFYTTLWALTNVAFGLERGDSFAVAQRARRVGLAHIGATRPALADVLDRFTRAVEGGAWSLEADAMGGVGDLFDDAAARADATLPAGDRLWPIVADTFLAAGYMVWYTPHEPLSERFFGQALEIQRRELPPDHPDTATTVGLLVGVLNNLDRSAEAEQLIRGSIDALRRVHGEDAYPVAIAESTLGDSLLRQGRFEEAEPILLRSHEAMLATVQDESQFMVLESFVRLVNLYEAWGRPKQGAPYRESLARTSATSTYIMQWDVSRRAFGPEHASLLEILDRVDELCGGISYRVSAGTQTAAPLAALLPELAARRSELLDDRDPRSAASARLLLGWANALDPGREVEARRLMATEALAVLRSWSDELPMDTAEALAILAASAGSAGRTSEARGLAREAWRAMRDVPTDGAWFGDAAGVRIGRCLLALELYEEAEPLLRRGHETLVAHIGAGHPGTRTARRLLFDLYTAWGRPEEAEAYADPAGLDPE